MIAKVDEDVDNRRSLIADHAERDAGDHIADKVTQLRQHKVHNSDDNVADNRDGPERGVESAFDEVAGVAPSHHHLGHADICVRRDEFVSCENSLINAVPAKRIIIEDIRSVFFVRVEQVLVINNPMPVIILNEVAQCASAQKSQPVRARRIVINVALVFVAVTFRRTHLDLIDGRFERLPPQVGIQLVVL